VEKQSAFVFERTTCDYDRTLPEFLTGTKVSYERVFTR